MDRIGDSLDFVASGIAYRLHVGRGYSYLARHCPHLISVPTYSGTKNIIAIWISAGEGEASGKEGGKQVRKYFAESFDASTEKAS